MKSISYTINAADKKLGRVASEAAKLLMGKNLTSFVRNEVPDVKVVIENASKADISQKKLTGVTYKRYSGYPGGQKTRALAELKGHRGIGEAFRIAVYGMLPTNKLRPRMIKNLTVKE